MKDEFIGMADAAKLLQVSAPRAARTIIEREIELGAKIEYVKVTERAYVIRRSDLERIIEKRKAMTDGTGKVGKGRPKKELQEIANAPVSRKKPAAPAVPA